MIRRAGVVYILDTVFEMLSEDDQRTFTWAEIAHFERWWRQQSEEVKTAMRDFVKEGRFEFVHGGYSLHDEATAHYEDIITNMKLGLEFLDREF